MLLSCLQAAIAPTDAAMVFWDLKFGLEAEAWRERYTEVCTTQPDVLASCGRVLALAEERAAILRRLDCRNVTEADALGVRLRRVYVLVDEVAELAFDHDAEKSAEKVLRELLRIVQLVRAMGIHVVLCGQRFGSDLGRNITSIRAQVSGRICLQVNDPQTAEMVLGGLDTEVQKRALTLHRPGLAIVQDGQQWNYARCSYLSTVEIRALAAAQSDKRVTWDAARCRRPGRGRGRPAGGGRVMSTLTTITVTVLVIALALIYVMGRARTLGPLVMVGVLLGAAAGISATALFGGMT